jgi:hypothetical protein
MRKRCYLYKYETIPTTIYNNNHIKFWEMYLTDYKIEIKEILKKDCENNKESGIWVNITDLETRKTMKKRIWWKNRDGIMHDGTTDLPVNIRDLVDNAWIEYSRKSKFFNEH